MIAIEVTGRQLEYLAFIGQFEALMGLPPTEGEVAHYFDPRTLPILSAPGRSERDSARAWSSFGLWVAEQFVARQGFGLAKIGRLEALRDRLDGLLVAGLAKPSLRRRTCQRLETMVQDLLAHPFQRREALPAPSRAPASSSSEATWCSRRYLATRREGATSCGVCEERGPSR